MIFVGKNQRKCIWMEVYVEFYGFDDVFVQNFACHGVPTRVERFMPEIPKK